MIRMIYEAIIKNYACMVLPLRIKLILLAMEIYVQQLVLTSKTIQSSSSSIPHNLKFKEQLKSTKNVPLEIDKEKKKPANIENCICGRSGVDNNLVVFI